MSLTIEQVEQFIALADIEGLVNAVAGMPEAERRKLSQATAKLHREIGRNPFRVDPKTNVVESVLPDRLTRWLQSKMYPIYRDQLATAELALLVFCPFTVVKSVTGVRYDEYMSNKIYKVLADRRPDWINDWIEENLKRDWITIKWSFLQRLIEAGICAKPNSEGYIRLMVSNLPDSGWKKENYTPLSTKLRNESDLLQNEVWRLFEVETNAFVYDGENRPDWHAEYESWGKALCKLADEGLLDQQRLLDGCLKGLTTGFNNNILSGYIKFHNRLQPTAEELAARQGAYLDLCSHQAAHVVGFAIKQLKTIDKHKQLDDQAFLAVAGRVLDLRVKAHAKAALQLVRKAVKRKPDLTNAAVKIAADGLAHESADIQEFCVTLLEEWVKNANDNIVEILQARSPEVSAACRTRLEALLEHFGADVQFAEESDRNVDLEEMHMQLRERISALSELVKNSAGVNLAVQSRENNALCPCWDFDLYEAPVLTVVEPIEPIETLEKLLDAVAHALEEVDSADEVERILEGISRLCDQRPEDFERRTGPLLKRIQEGPGASNRGLLGSWGTPPALWSLLMSWLTRKPISWTYCPADYDKVTAVMLPRLEELALRAGKGIAAPLLAAPTHQGGWIDPRILVERFLVYQEMSLQIPMYDFTQSLLRMAPDHREEALSSAQNVNGNVGRILRWALGGEEKPTRKDKKLASVWLAAGRARNPKGRLDELACLKLKGIGPDGMVPAQYTWHAYISQTEDRWSKKIYHHPKLKLTVGGEMGKYKKWKNCPTLALHYREKWYVYGIHAPWLVQWISMLWPQNLEGFFAAGIDAFMSRIDDSSSSWSPNFMFLHPLLMPDRPWSAMAVLLLWLGLVGRDADVQGYAIEVLADGIQDGRAHPDSLSRVLIKLAEGGWLKLNRMSQTLQEVSRLSVLHQYVIAHIIMQYLGAQKTIPRDAHHVLTLLHELLNQLDMSLEDQARQLLLTAKGSSKTAKLAKSLLSHQASTCSRQVSQALLQNLEARVTRAERWQRVE